MPLYSAAYDFFELLSPPCAEPEDERCPAAAEGGKDVPMLRNAPDIRLSTAALTSARFPIVSPAGVLRVISDAKFGDRIVDGGYFENSGLTTALDIASALKAENVTPVVLWVQNEPIIDRPNTKTPRRPAATPQVGRINEGVVTDAVALLTEPVDTVLSTREGHGAEAADLAVRALEAMNKSADPNASEKSFFQIGVRAVADLSLDAGSDPGLQASCAPFAGKPLTMTKVSMSWWLSAGVQSDLDVQLCDKRNQKSLDDLMHRLASPAGQAGSQ
jgi:hypothetical protein